MTASAARPRLEESDVLGCEILAIVEANRLFRTVGEMKRANSAAKKR